LRSPVQVDSPVESDGFAGIGAVHVALAVVRPLGLSRVHHISRLIVPVAGVNLL
jgi:hypothetical protein